MYGVGVCVAYRHTMLIRAAWWRAVDWVAGGNRWERSWDRRPASDGAGEAAARFRSLS